MKLKFLLPVAVMALVLASCGKKGWTDEQKETYMKACTEPVKGMVGEDGAKKICECGLEKLEAKFPDAKEINQDDARKIGEECAMEYMKVQ